MIDTIAAPVDTGFAALGLTTHLVDVLTALGYEEPTPIQAEAIPPLLQGRDLLGQAATGTGKTAAFALPLLQRLAPRGGRDGPAALVLVPTRELAMQVAAAVHRYGRGLGVRVLAVYGGQAFEPQLHALARGVDVVVATPGRAVDHLRRGTLRLGGVSAVVLDEADEMFDMGFAEDLEAILAGTPAARQTMLFSATMPPHVAAVARRHLTDPVEVRPARADVPAGEAPRVRQTAYVVQRAHKLAALARVLDVEAPPSALVFCRTRVEVDELVEALGARGYRPQALHGGMSQEQRDRVMRVFRAGTAALVVATDVAARGLDVERLSHVINYHLPAAAESYVHRIGRVGRAGREGVAITLVEPAEQRLLRGVERVTGQRIDVAPLPTAADLRARRLGLTEASLREALLGGGLEPYRGVVEALAGEFDPAEVALAAVKLAHTAAHAAGEGPDIPTPPPARERFAYEREGPRRGPARDRGPAAGMARVYIGAGREAGLAPRDLVGAIANEAGVSGRDLGAIEIAGRFSLVDVPEGVAGHVIESLRRGRIKGRKATVRRDRGWGG